MDDISSIKTRLDEIARNQLEVARSLAELSAKVNQLSTNNERMWSIIYEHDDTLAEHSSCLERVGERLAALGQLMEERGKWVNHIKTENERLSEKFQNFVIIILGSVALIDLLTKIFVR